MSACAAPSHRRRWSFAIVFFAACGPLLQADVLPPPANLTAQSGGDRVVALTWTPSAGATSYVVLRSTTQNDTNAREVAQGVTGTSFTVASLSNDTTYYFRVKAVGPEGTSGFSGEAAATTKITKQALPDGIYTLAPKHAPRLRLQAGTRERHSLASLAFAADSPAQQWRVTAVDLQTYWFAPVSDPAQALTVEGAEAGINAQTVEYVVRSHQQWKAVPVAGGFRLVPAGAPGLALTADGKADGDFVTQAAAVGSAAQVWTILPVTESAPDPGTAYVPAGYRLAFSDEFNGGAIDAQKWETLAPYSQPHLNDELENYLPEAVALRDGCCVLTAEPHDAPCLLAGRQPAPPCGGVHHWRSGAITSRLTFTHGYFEARFRIPQGPGLWPAFWLTSSKRWPPEWDIVEIPNTVGTLYQYMHPTKAAKLTWVEGLDGPDSILTAADGMPNPYTGFVVYGCEVTSEGVKLWVNGKLTGHWKISADATDPMWVSLNLAVGGKWPGSPDETTPRPAEMVVDYVRVYGRE